jgi:hypothetical protein
MGATLADVLADYASKLKTVNGRLNLSGIHAHAYEQLVGSGRLSRDSSELAYKATPLRGKSTNEAVADAYQWLADKKESD